MPLRLFWLRLLFWLFSARILAICTAIHRQYILLLVRALWKLQSNITCVWLQIVLTHLHCLLCYPMYWMLARIEIGLIILSACHCLFTKWTHFISINNLPKPNAIDNNFHCLHKKFAVFYETHFQLECLENVTFWRKIEEKRFVPNSSIKRPAIQ